MINAIFARYRVILLVYFMLAVAGFSAFQSIPKENMPDVTLPIIQVTTGLSGIAAAEADRDLARPLIATLKSLEGLKHINTTSNLGGTSLQLTLESGVDVDNALVDVREKLSRVRNDLPDDAIEPIASEVNVSLFPVIQVAVRHDNVNERKRIADELKESIESIGEVLEVTASGNQVYELQVIADTQKLALYGITYAQVGQLVDDYIRLAPLGSMSSDKGRWNIELENGDISPEGLGNIVILHDENNHLTLKDIAKIEFGFKNPSQVAWVDGKEATVLSVVKRTGKNLVHTVEQTKSVVLEFQAQYPETEIDWLQDTSKEVDRSLNNLINNVIFSTFIVGVIIILFMGLAPGLMVALSIPASFLMSIFVINQLGYTLNVVSFFGLILSIGLLVDCIIVIVEYAEKEMLRGVGIRDAFINSATNMFWPIVNSTLTTFCAFIPLMFWPGLMGSFMVYIPMSILCTLTSALLVGLVVLPALVQLKKTGWVSEEEAGFSWIELRYQGLIAGLVNRPKSVLATAVIMLFAGFGAFGVLNKGVTFFPDIEAEQLLVSAEAQGNLSDGKKNAIAALMNEKLEGLPGIRHQTTTLFYEKDDAEIITVLLELDDWQLRTRIEGIEAELNQRLADLLIDGLEIKVEKPAGGPSSAYDIEFYVTGIDRAQIVSKSDELMEYLRNKPEIKMVKDDSGRAGKSVLEFVPITDRMRIANVLQTDISQSLQIMTNGLKLGSTRINAVKDEIEIRGYYATPNRDEKSYQSIWLPNSVAPVPLQEVVAQQMAPSDGLVKRYQDKLSVKISASLLSEHKAQAQVILKELEVLLAQSPALSFEEAGDAESQAETSAFLGQAFAAALLSMIIIMTAQFNSIKQALLVMSGIVFGLMAILVGITLKQVPFIIVMNGMGVIALAGIILNNNIILIDAFNQYLKEGLSRKEAAIQAASMRMKPVMLTALTTVMGLMPMMLGLGIDLVNMRFTWQSPDAMWWMDLSYAIGFGMGCATLLTLLVTPTLLGIELRWNTVERT